LPRLVFVLLLLYAAAHFSLVYPQLPGCWPLTLTGVAFPTAGSPSRRSSQFWWL